MLAPLAGTLALTAAVGGLWWVGQDASAANAARVAMAAQDRDCADFASRVEAQDYFDSRGYSATVDPERLDGDNDGVPCEGSLPAAGPGQATPPPADDGVSAEDRAAIERGELNAK